MNDIVKKMSEIFKALSDSTELRIIRMMASNMENNICVADLAKKLGVVQPTASQHIKVLNNVCMLEPNRDGFHVFYNISADVLSDFKKISMNCLKWHL